MESEGEGGQLNDKRAEDKQQSEDSKTAMMTIPCNLCDKPTVPIPASFCQGPDVHVICDVCFHEFLWKLDSAEESFSSSSRAHFQCPVALEFVKEDEDGVVVKKKCGSTLVGMAEIGLPIYLNLLMTKVPLFQCSSKGEGCTFVGTGYEVVDHETNSCVLREFTICKEVGDNGDVCMEVMAPHDIVRHLMTAHRSNLQFLNQVAVELSFVDEDCLSDAWKPHCRIVIDYSHGGEDTTCRFCLLAYDTNRTHIRMWLTKLSGGNMIDDMESQYKLTIPYLKGAMAKVTYEFSSTVLPYGTTFAINEEDDAGQYFEVSRKFVKKYWAKDGCFSVLFEFAVITGSESEEDVDKEEQNGNEEDSSEAEESGTSLVEEGPVNDATATSNAGKDVGDSQKEVVEASESPSDAATEYATNVAAEHVPDAIIEFATAAVTESVPEAAIDTLPDPATEFVTEVAPETVTEFAIEAATEVVLEAATETVPEAATETVPEAATETVPEAVIETVPKAVTETVPKAATETVPEATTEVVLEATTEVVPEAATETVPEATTEVVPEATTEVVNEYVPDAVIEVATEAATEFAPTLGESIPDTVTEFETEIVLEAVTETFSDAATLSTIDETTDSSDVATASASQAGFPRSFRACRRDKFQEQALLLKAEEPKQKPCLCAEAAAYLADSTKDNPGLRHVVFGPVNKVHQLTNGTTADSPDALPWTMKTFDNPKNDFGVVASQQVEEAVQEPTGEEPSASNGRRPGAEELVELYPDLPGKFGDMIPDAAFVTADDLAFYRRGWPYP